MPLSAFGALCDTARRNRIHGIVWPEMTQGRSHRSSPLPSVDRVLAEPTAQRLIEDYGRDIVVAAVREELADLRDERARLEVHLVVERAERRLSRLHMASLRRVFNLTGTVLHTNLGRATLPGEVVDAVATAIRWPSNLEYDLEQGKRGERDSHVRSWLVRLTGAEDATVVNNNAAAVFLVLNTLSLRREVLVSRGELIEIGGSFRIPEIMSRAGCRLVEVGTTNRTHLRDYDAAIGARTALLMSVHPSNFAIVGFTATVKLRDLAELAHSRDLAYVVDLGSGSLVNLEEYGLPHEPTPREALADGADIVTFSGDKLLGGPQAGIIVGRAELVKRINRNPLKRALRLDKGRIAALEATLRIYADPARLASRLPSLTMLARPQSEILAQGMRLLAVLRAKLEPKIEIEIQNCHSQIGSGSFPVDQVPSHCLALRYRAANSGRPNHLAARLRKMPIPVIGRIEKGWVKLDLRTLDDERTFLDAFDALDGI